MPTELSFHEFRVSVRVLAGRVTGILVDGVPDAVGTLSAIGPAIESKLQADGMLSVDGLVEVSFPMPNRGGVGCVIIGYPVAGDQEAVASVPQAIGDKPASERP